MKLAVLYICTGKYIKFWDEFFNSCEKYFLTDMYKEYFVFTDASQVEHEHNQRIHRIYQEKMGWPYDTLMRFHLFNKIEDELKRFDYIYFFNANTKFVKVILPSDIIPDKDSGLVGVIHPLYQDLQQDKIPYERNQNQSLAFVPKDTGQYYFQGCLSGGDTVSYIALIRELKRRIQIDLDNKIIAEWHDESHLNKYFIEHPPKMLHSGFAYPEGWMLPYEIRVLMLDKAKHGGHKYLRETKSESSLYQNIKDFLIKRLSKINAVLYK